MAQGSQDSSMQQNVSQVESKAVDENGKISDKVDLNDLDWEDRERVLRLLFSK